ncbi:MAG TPA: 50S ribosomal protein L24 [Patescibacteria group bacterium]|nr:50S ribosomal protein L24 [Patescibacteria group bacterium]
MSTKNTTQVYKIRLKKGDKIVVLSGKYKGENGIVQATRPKENKVTVEGINVVKKAVKPNKQYPQGGIIEVTKPIWASKVAIVDPVSNKPSRIGYNVSKSGEKLRVYKKSGKEIK